MKMKMPSLIVSNETLVVLDDEVQKIIDRLTRGTKELDVVSIVGMPGLGKTTLAKNVYEDPSITYHFHARSWCTVSQVYSKRSLLLAISLGLDKDLAAKCSQLGEDDWADKLRKHLKGKRFVIILDDIWDVEAWHTLKDMLPNDANGSRILLTSRYHGVASQIKPDRAPHPLRPLTNDESWELLKKKICFEEEYTPGLLACGKAIARDCKGLPLMIVVVSGLLSNMDPATWEEVAQSLSKGTLSITEQCWETLELSYSHLPHYLKPCFLYFGVAFEEDKQIPVRQLLWLWIAEGFVEKNERKCLEEVALGYMTELLQRSLVMVAKKGSRGSVKSCVLHDILLEFCKAKCNEEGFLYHFHGDKCGTSMKPNILDRVSFHSGRVTRLLFHHLRTVFFVPNCTISEEDTLEFLFQFSQSNFLRITDLRGICLGSIFPSPVEQLVHLTFLALSVSGLTYMIPPSIENLSNLETFIVEGRAQHVGHVCLPETVWNMKKLKHLWSTAWTAYWKFPKENPKHQTNLENLETLSNLQFSFDQRLRELLGKFPNLQRLKCEFVWPTLSSGYCYPLLTLGFMSQLESLTLSSHGNRFFNVYLQLPHNLKKLTLSRFRLPWSKISEIKGLPNLEVLKLRLNTFIGENWDMEEGTFLGLRFLKLETLDIARWTGDSEDSFPCLEKLVLKRCERLEEVPSCLAYISTLEIIEMTGCGSAINSVKQIQEEQMSMGNEDLKILVHEPPKWNNIKLAQARSP